MMFPESELAKHYLLPLVRSGKRGIEIGGSAHNSWGEQIMSATLNLDYTEEITLDKQAEIDLCGRSLPVDIIGKADAIPLKDNSVSWIINSHVFEHVANPIRCIEEWYRVLEPGGLVYSVVPHRNALASDVGRSLTTWQHILMDWVYDVDEDTHPVSDGCDRKHGHYHVFDLDSFLDIVAKIGSMLPGFADFEIVDSRGVDDKVGNGFVVVMRKPCR